MGLINLSVQIEGLRDLLRTWHKEYEKVAAGCGPTAAPVSGS